MSKPVVSVLCATYNQREYLRDTINGILSQRTSFAFELVINDDASTDGTADIIRDYGVVDARIKAIYQVENQFSKGRTPRDFLLPSARGEFLAWCEGDDVWTDPFKLQKQVDLLRTDHNLSGCFTDYSWIDLNGDAIGINRKLKVRQAFTHLDVLRSGCPKTLTLMLRSDALLELINNLHSFQGLKNGDQLVCAFATQYGDIAFLPEVTGAYRVGSGFWSTMGNSSQSRTLVESFLKMAEFFDSPEEKRAVSERLTKRLALLATSDDKEGRIWAQEVRSKMASLGLNFDQKLYMLEKLKLSKTKLRLRLKNFLYRRDR